VPTDEQFDRYMTLAVEILDDEPSPITRWADSWIKQMDETDERLRLLLADLRRSQLRVVDD
jgi:hypothetical protein